ncbi:hypothetical protein ACFXAE_23535 [Streptomyces sp. NPDC059454]|jgi:hypothetical protein|uniref:hypothetical protein n=1 Tax=Streptomyces sp. NPDC059454 TaxID=3346836 RepID=UPI003677887F
MPGRLLELHVENLAGFLIHLSGREEIWHDLVSDARTVLPQLERLDLTAGRGSVGTRTHGCSALHTICHICTFGPFRGSPGSDQVGALVRGGRYF